MSRKELQDLIIAAVKLALQEQNDSNSKSEEILDIQEAADFLKLKVHTLYGYTSQKQIPFIKRGKKLYFERAKLELWLIEGRSETIRDIQKRLK